MSITISPRMADANFAIDAFINWGANERGWQPSTQRSYRRLLDKLVDQNRHKATQDFEREDYEQFLSQWVTADRSTRASLISLINTWMWFLHKRAMAPHYEAFDRPKRLPAKDLKVTRITLDDATKLILHCHDWQERLCIETAMFSGFRRAALSGMRRGDVELVRKKDGSVLGYLTATDKGGKTQTKPLPRQYVDTIIEADAAGVWDSPGAYLIPNRRPAAMRRQGERSDKVIWMTVKKIADRAGVRSHVHALRAVFAEACAEMGLDLIEIQDLMGHSRPETTQVYLDRRGREKRMEKVRELTFGVFQETGPALGASPTSSEVPDGRRDASSNLAGGASTTEVAETERGVDIARPSGFPGRCVGQPIPGDAPRSVSATEVAS